MLRGTAPSRLSRDRLWVVPEPWQLPQWILFGRRRWCVWRTELDCIPALWSGGPVAIPTRRARTSLRRTRHIGASDALESRDYVFQFDETPRRVRGEIYDEF